MTTGLRIMPFTDGTTSAFLLMEGCIDGDETLRIMLLFRFIDEFRPTMFSWSCMNTVLPLLSFIAGNLLPLTWLLSFRRLKVVSG